MREVLRESEAKLREVFEEAARRAPAILFIDEIDAVAPKRAEVAGEVEKRRSGSALEPDGWLPVPRRRSSSWAPPIFPRCSIRRSVARAAFDREIEIGVPSTQARLQILKIHTRAMPLGPDVDLAEVAEHSTDSSAPDLEALCQEVGMITLRRYLSTAALDAEDGLRARETRSGDTGAADLSALQVTREDFLAGLREVEPSATREFFIEKSTSTFASLARADRGQTSAAAPSSSMRTCDDDLYEARRPCAAARHLARGAFRDRQDCDGARALRRESSFR